jgi:hypothetical protein
MNNNQFFIVGAQRSGTTYLYTILDEHPEICMAKPVKPEPKYFLTSKYNEAEYYKNYYNHKTDKTKIFGEKSTSYYESEAIAQKIATNIPLAKIIFILADPVDRAISNYKFSFENGLETRSIEDVFINNVPIYSSKYNTSVNPFDYKERGIYHKFIKCYYNNFSKENIKIIVREDLVGNINAIQDLYKFLDVDSSHIPVSLKTIINPSKSNIDSHSLSLAQDKLANFYQEYNIILKDQYMIDISLWRK